MQNRIFILFCSVAVVSCSSHMISGADRRPAGSAPTPFVPGSENIGPPVNNNKGGHTGQNTPKKKPRQKAPPRERSQEAENSSEDRQPREDMAVCEPPIQERRFAFLESKNFYGTQRRDFSALDGLLKGAGVPGSLTGSLEHDKNILAEWFGEGFTKNSEVFRVAQYSPLYRMIFDYAQADESKLREPTVQVGSRLAFYLAVLMSVSDNTECMRAVLGLGDQLFADLKNQSGGAVYVEAFKELSQAIGNFVADAQLGKADDKFDELAINKTRAEEKYLYDRRQVERSEFKVENAQQSFVKKLQTEANKVSRIIEGNKGCVHVAPKFSVDNYDKEIEMLANDLKDCVAVVEEKRDFWLEKVASYEQQGKQNTASYSDAKGQVEAFNKRIEKLSSNQPGAAVGILLKMKESSKGYASIAKQLEQLRILREELAEQERGFKLLATPYLTHGYLGGFIR